MSKGLWVTFQLTFALFAGIILHQVLFPVIGLALLPFNFMVGMCLGVFGKYLEAFVVRD